MTHNTNAGSVPPATSAQLDISFNQDALSQLVTAYRAHGDAFRVFAPAIKKDVFVFSHPDHVRRVLVDNHQNYTKGIGIDRVGILLGKGLMVSEGEFWHRQRRMIQPAFHRDVISRMVGHVTGANEELLARWIDNARRGGEINVTQDMSDLALNIVLRSIFGADLRSLMAPDGSNPFSLLTEETERNLTFAYRFRALSKLIMDLVNRRRASDAPRDDLLGMLMAARDRKSGEPMPHKQLLDETMTLIVAGHETTASALNWMWYLLSQNPQVEAKLHSEIDVAQAQPSSTEDAAQLGYTRQVIEESLRLYPPGWLLTRRSIDADVIGGFEVAPNTDVFISPYLIHRNQQFWSDPEHFNPDRFSAADAAGRNRFCYLPFALGPRACIGEHFAMIEMIIHAAMLARRIRLRYLPKHPLELECQVNLRSKHGIYMLPELR